ncbi:C40 family peptidase [Streptosporangium algeriense]|uniref:C40 family peptidase n=1 Tax=Streptosporangium algeriense TaxID=1682748 RepID=A0ABW3E3B6_9ACTN
MALSPATAQATTETAVAVQARSTAKSTEQSTAGNTAKARVKRKAKAAMNRAARQRSRARTAVATARKQVGDPYRWGASGPGAFDCSGLVQYAWRKAGVSLPRVTGSQYRAVRKKVSWSKLRLGDLLFFYGKGHVGMYVGHGKMIHSPSSGKSVRIVTLKGYYRSAFAGAVRPGT